MCVRVRRKIFEAKYGHTDIVIVVEAVEALQVLCNVEIETSADIRLAQRHREVTGEFREGRDGGKLLAVLPGAFTLHMPEEAILEDIAAQASAEVLALEGRFLRPRGRPQTQV